jgi:hypothetical protein
MEKKINNFDEILLKEVYSFKCKPVYNFQSIEFEFVGGKDDIPQMIDLYQEVLKNLMAISPEQPNTKAPIQRANIIKPSPRQYEIMDSFGIPYNDMTTREQASKLITESMEKSNR